MTLKRSVGALFLALAFGRGTDCRAEVRTNPLFADGMVLQQGMRVPVWGTADEGEAVTVTIQNRKSSGIARDGKWMVWLDNLKAGGPFEMAIAGKNTLSLKNVLVGEVWLCSGQSNMSWKLEQAANAREAINHADNPAIRLFTVPKTISATPRQETGGAWEPCTPKTAGGFSAVAYYFGRDLARELRVPIGLIEATWGGTLIESWMSRGAWEAIGMAGKQQVILSNAAPSDRSQELDHPGVLYNGMIAPLVPFALRGYIWYQGESNTSRPLEYRALFPALIKNWRHDWGKEDLPLLFVQLAPYKAIASSPQESAWAELREAQLMTFHRVPRTAMAVITDLGDPDDIHPRRKEPVAARLVVAALAIAYGHAQEFSGPIYDQMKVEGNKAIISFKHLGGGLVSKGPALEGFAIAGEDRRFVDADAEIEGDRVAVWSSRVAKPVAVRFGWADYPVVNLWNKAGLPASPFRTDDFPREVKQFLRSGGRSRTRLFSQ